jgi:hypothetical protein
MVGGGVEEVTAHCWHCDKEITGKHYNCQDMLFHVECLVCKACSKPLDRYCLNEDELYCVDCYRANFVRLPSCAACNAEIATASLAALNATYHPDCFKCSYCSQVIRDDYVEYQGKAYCALNVAPCYKLARGSICCSCNKPLQENYLKVLGRLYHKGECFKCAGCSTPFNSLEYYPINDLPYCEPCALKLSDQDT